jgi:hypothetical protein
MTTTKSSLISHTGQLDGIEGLDISVFALDDGEWQVWTPWLDGACIGSGKSRAEALQSAVANLRKAADGIAAHLSASAERRSELAPAELRRALLACPFCGDVAELDTQRGFRALNGKLLNEVAIYCTACPADMSLCGEDMPPEFTNADLVATLTTRWNTRQRQTTL